MIKSSNNQTSINQKQAENPNGKVIKIKDQRKAIKSCKHQTTKSHIYKNANRGIMKIKDQREAIKYCKRQNPKSSNHQITHSSNWGIIKIKDWREAIKNCKRKNPKSSNRQIVHSSNCQIIRIPKSSTTEIKLSSTISRVKKRSVIQRQQIWIKILNKTLTLSEQRFGWNGRT